MLDKFLKSQLYVRKSPNLIKLGFDFTKSADQEYRNIQSILTTDYLIHGESTLTIMKKYNIPSSRTMDILFRLFNIESRNASEAAINASLKNRIEPRRRKYQHIYHMTWYGETVYFRSSYELAYAKELDSKKIMYYVESIRLKYYDSKLQKYRVAVPDFYIPSENLLVEIKATYWYDPENMKEKQVEYKKNGFNCKLILDGIEQ